VADNRVVLFGCGDVGPIHEPMDAYSTLARPTLATADLRFAQCERIYSDRGAQQTQGSPHPRIKPHMASVFSDCGFDVVSVASNHTMDFGEDALLDTIDNFRRRGIQAIGAGRNLEEARQPAIIERNGVRVAFLAYCSVLQTGYAAGPKRAGIAPMRAHTYYQPLSYQPGVPPRVVTIPYEEDLAGMVDDIAGAKRNAHAVVVSMHWGIHFIPRVIADYQRTVAAAAFAAGADLILGHHPHIPKAIGVHGGKVCFYSLSSFIMSTHASTTDHFSGPLGVKPDPDYPRLPYGPDAKRSLVAKALLSRDGVERVSFMPVLIDTQLRPEFLREGDARFAEAVRYLDWASEEFDHRFVVERDEIFVTAP
jgi:poly-gamma-glutamate synthesis protein (capsule biosynthesis protein)